MVAVRDDPREPEHAERFGGPTVVRVDPPHPVTDVGHQVLVLGEGQGEGVQFAMAHRESWRTAALAECAKAL